MSDNVYNTESSLKNSFSSKEFETMLVQNTARNRKHAKRNYLTAYVCYAIAIAASLLSTIAIAADFPSKPVLALVAAIPGTALLVNSVFSLEKKSAWHYEKYHHYESLLYRVRFEGFSIPSASKELRTFNEEMERLYPKFGMMPQAIQQRESLNAPRD